MVENLTALVKDGKFKIHNINDVAEAAVRQFEDYGYSISDKGKTIVYGNMTAGKHDDAVSASYFAVADVTINSLEEAVNYYDGDKLHFVKNKYNTVSNIKGSFY